MKHIRLIMALAAFAFVFAGCKKVEVVSISTNPMLPLAIGNQWVYVDTFITTTTLPSSDTLVADVTYTVTREATVDRYLIDASKGKTMQRLHGYEIANPYSVYGQPTWIAIGDTLYSTSEYRYLYPYYSTNCNNIQGGFLEKPASIPTYRGNLQPSISVPNGNGQTLNYYPGFMDLPMCLDLGPLDYYTASYKIFLHPLTPSDSLENIMTPAGTFICTNFGSQYWAEGVGMIQSYNEGEAAFYDDDYKLQTGLLKWKRTLKSYHLE